MENGYTPDDIAELFWRKEQKWKESEGIIESPCERQSFESLPFKQRLVKIAAARDVLKELNESFASQKEEARQEISRLNDEHATDIHYKEKIQKILNIDFSGSDTHGSWDEVFHVIRNLLKDMKGKDDEVKRLTDLLEADRKDLESKDAEIKRVTELYADTIKLDDRITELELELKDTRAKQEKDAKELMKEKSDHNHYDPADTV